MNNNPIAKIKSFVQNNQKNVLNLLFGNLILAFACFFFLRYFTISFSLLVLVVGLCNILTILILINHAKRCRKKTILKIRTIIYNLDFKGDYVENCQTLFDDNDEINTIFKKIGNLLENKCPINDFYILATSSYVELCTDFMLLSLAAKRKSWPSDAKIEIVENKEEGIFNYLWLGMSFLTIVVICYSLFQVLGAIING